MNSRPLLANHDSLITDGRDESPECFILMLGALNTLNCWFRLPLCCRT